MSRTVLSRSVMSRRSAVLTAISGGWVLAAAALIAHAGPLDPPAGSVASSYKTLSEVEPRIAVGPATTPGDSDGTPSLYKITQPGSYYLAGNVTGVSGRIGIEIVASGVTLDLMGFELLGVAGALDGVRVTTAGVANVAVVNGSVRNWDDDGVDVSSAQGVRVEGVLASGNSDAGIRAGVNAVIIGCTARQNASSGVSSTGGISTLAGCTIKDCSVSLNNGYGINTTSGCVVMNCSVQANADGILVNSGSTVVGCTLYNNSGDGIIVTGDCLVRSNMCLNNGALSGSGIWASSSDNRIEDNNSTGADIGIRVTGTGNFISRNTCSGNTTNWDIASGNVCLVVLGATSGAITGDSGGVSPGSTNPNANYTY
ncbi:MAG: right-handed parallel beta-helix repeat-containing protein [Phycisphaerales bacterium]|nr:right-handed parallel beta-helix repeat-containing protein [Phycisphaerales bacterium]